MTKYKGNSRFDNGSKLTDSVCDLIGWTYINALKTMQRGTTIYVKGTLLKPNEVHDLLSLQNQTINNYIIKVVNYKNWENMI